METLIILGLVFLLSNKKSAQSHSNSGANEVSDGSGGSDGGGLPQHDAYTKANFDEATLKPKDDTVFRHDDSVLTEVAQLRERPSLWERERLASRLLRPGIYNHVTPRLTSDSGTAASGGGSDFDGGFPSGFFRA